MSEIEKVEGYQGKDEWHRKVAFWASGLFYFWPFALGEVA